MKQCQYYPQNNRNCSDCRMNMEQERGKSKIAIAAFDKYYLLLVLKVVLVGEMNLSKSGEFGVTSFLSLWHMRSRVL